MAAILEVLARWDSLDEELEIAAALGPFCLSPNTSDWLVSLEESYPLAKQAWSTAKDSLAKLIEVEGPFNLSVSSVSSLTSAHDSKPNHAPTLSLGYVEALSVHWKHPALVKAAHDLAKLLEALGATWCLPNTLD